MDNCRELLQKSGLFDPSNEGDGVRVAVLDDGIPNLKDILVCYSKNFTLESSKGSGHAEFIGSLLFGKHLVKGICPAATACFGKVFSNGVATPHAVARGIIWAVDNWNADIINLSLGFSSTSECPKDVKEACSYAYKKGKIIIAAAGNDGGHTLWPAALPEVISVGSAVEMTKADFSNIGKIDFVLPGKDLQGMDVDGSVVQKSGTSFSAAIMTGIVALILAHLKHRNEPFSFDKIKNMLIDICLDLESPGWDIATGYGFPFGHLIQNIIQVSCTNTGFFDKIKMWIKKIFNRIIRRNNGY